MNIRFFTTMLMAVFTACILNAASYKVCVESSLNLRAEPSVSAAVIVQLPGGAIVESEEEWEAGDENWVKVVYGTNTEGYVKSSYLRPVETVARQERQGKHWFELLDWSGDGYGYLVYIILALALVMWAELKFVRRMPLGFYTDDDEGRLKLWIGINSFLLTLTSLLVFFYLKEMGRNALWFLTPALYKSWIYVAINFIFFVYALINIFAMFYKTFVDISCLCGTYINLRTGIYSWLAGIVVLIFFSIFERNDPWYVYLAIGALQLVQMGIIIYKTSKRGHFLLGLWGAVLYAVASTAIVLFASVVVFVLLAIVIAGTILVAMLKGSQTSVGSGPGGTSTYWGNETPYGSGNYTISTPDGNIYLRPMDGNSYSGSDGRTYRKSGSYFSPV